MFFPELSHLESLADLDRIVSKLRQWAEVPTDWEPAQSCQHLVRRVLPHCEAVRVRLEAPLVVATFGGTGTGKSALVNALVGRNVTESGRQRPTTLQPVLLAHSQVDLEQLGLPADEVRVVRCDVDRLRDLIIIDCPDPDTTEVENPESNLARLHRLLPYCDVLLYTSTQQKYRSARVGEELLQAAAGCRIVFVQTFADLDTDIREDWGRHMQDRFEIPEMFFIDSLRAVREQQAGMRVAGDFQKLLDLLDRHRTTSSRAGIRRSNLLELVSSTVRYCLAALGRAVPALEKLEEELHRQRQSIALQLARQLQTELLRDRSAWEHRLLTAVISKWGLSPFAWVLRAYSGFGGLLTSLALFRVRSVTQAALLGTVEGARRLRNWQRDRSAEERLANLPSFVEDVAPWRESQLILAGFAREAKFDSRLSDPLSEETLRGMASVVSERFFSDASGRFADLVDRLAERRSGVLVRLFYEFSLVALLTYLVGWSGYNFFFGHPWLGQPLISSEFYLHGLVFFTLWSGILIMLFLRRLRRGLGGEAARFCLELAQEERAGDCFPALTRACAEARNQIVQLEIIEQQVRRLRDGAGEQERLPELGRRLQVGAVD